VETPYRVWFPRMCEYGFTSGQDFNPYKNVRVQNEGNRQVKREIEDHQLTIPMAKEICMLQRSEKRKQFRQYFIAVEELWNSPKMVMARGLQMAIRKLSDLQSRCQQLEEKIQADKPKVLFADSVAAAKTSILVGELAKILKQNGVETGQKRLFQWLRDNGYLIRRNGSDHNMPTQKSMEMGLFEIKETSITHSDGHISVNKTAKVTGKGQVYFVNKLMAVAQEVSLWQGD